MKKMEEVRAFVAIELEPEIGEELAKVQARLKGKIATPHLRWVDPYAIHLTLKFLGNVPAERVEEIASALKEACAGFHPFSLRFHGLGCFPSPNNPRVIWVGLESEDDTLTRMQMKVEEALAPLDFPPERRPFHPHLTLGRVKEQVRGARRIIGGIVSATVVGELGRMEVEAISLMRSRLLPTGAQYSRLAEIPLPRDPGRMEG